MLDLMDAGEFRDAIARLGLSQVQAARFLGVEDRTARRWASQEGEGPPETVSMLLGLMLALELTPADVVTMLARQRAKKLAAK